MAKTKTASVRLPKEMYEEIDNICDEVGCSRNDWIKETLQDKLREESNENSQDQEVTKDTKPKIFDCKDGNLFHDGNLFGKCADFELNAGKVYDSFGKYLGQTRDSLKPTVTLID